MTYVMSCGAERVKKKEKQLVTRMHSMSRLMQISYAFHISGEFFTALPIFKKSTNPLNYIKLGKC